MGVPAIVLNIHYPTDGGRDARLASGSAYTAHADFLNSWDQVELERLVALCMRVGAPEGGDPCRAPRPPRPPRPPRR